MLKSILNGAIAGRTVSFLAFLLAFSVVRVAVATDYDLLFVSDFYDKCSGNRYLSPGDPAWEVAELIENNYSGWDIIATEVNNCSGTLYEYENYIDPVWDAFYDETHAVPGNHDYFDDADGFRDYFNVTSSITTYSVTVGSTNWKIIGLDSNLTDPVEQYMQRYWLFSELQDEQCSIVYFHHPRWSSGLHGSNTSMDNIWKIMADANVEIAISGHDHHFERFQPMDRDGNYDPDGVTQIVAGVGGADIRSTATPENNSLVIFDDDDDHGVVLFHMYDSGPYYMVSYVSAEGTLLNYWWGTCN